MTDKQMVAEIGRPTTKLVFILLGDVLYRRTDGAWEAYPPD